ncbi:MAG: (d)CMP kinase [Gammaproteobacteria bacterium]|nr:(d)CMP kinase [Gammaproteobacteria bacterium]
MSSPPRQPETPAAPVITLDGPSGSGKGTIARGLVARLGWHYLESGALYRVLGLLAARDGIALGAPIAERDIAKLSALAARLQLSFRDGGVFLEGEDVNAQIRSEAAGERASRIAPLPEVREALLGWQRRCACPPGLVADGRDMGTVVFPGAACKVFLTAGVEARARRRCAQLKELGFNVSIAQIHRELGERDRRDLSRAVSPLKPAEGAFQLDTTSLSAAEALVAVSARVARDCNLPEISAGNFPES